MARIELTDESRLTTDFNSSMEAISVLRRSGLFLSFSFMIPEQPERRMTPAISRNMTLIDLKVADIKRMKDVVQEKPLLHILLE